MFRSLRRGSVFVLLHHGVFSKEGEKSSRAFKPAVARYKGIRNPVLDEERAKVKGLEISDEASDYLIGLIGPDLSLLSSEIEKISLLGKQAIDVNDIVDIVTGGRLYGIFDLVDALREQDAEKVFAIYRSMRETAEDYSLIGALNWQYGTQTAFAQQQSRKGIFLKGIRASEQNRYRYKKLRQNFSDRISSG